MRKAVKRKTPKSNDLPKRGRGRPVKPPGDLPVYDTMAQASKAMGITVSILSRHKKAGAPGFRHGRVYGAEVAEYLKTIEAAPDADDKEKLQCRKLRVQCEQLEHDYATQQGKYFLRSYVESWITKRSEAMKSILVSRLKREMPPRLEGLRAPEIAVKMDAVCNEIIEAWRKPI